MMAVVIILGHSSSSNRVRVLAALSLVLGHHVLGWEIPYHLSAFYSGRNSILFSSLGI